MSLAIWSREGGVKVGEGREADWRILERVFVVVISHVLSNGRRNDENSKSCGSEQQQRVRESGMKGRVQIFC